MALLFLAEQQFPCALSATTESHLSLIVFERKGQVGSEILLSGSADVAGWLCTCGKACVGRTGCSFYLADSCWAGTVLLVAGQHVSSLIHQDVPDCLQGLAQNGFKSYKHRIKVCVKKDTLPKYLCLLLVSDFTQLKAEAAFQSLLQASKNSIKPPTQQ